MIENKPIDPQNPLKSSTTSLQTSDNNQDRSNRPSQLVILGGGSSVKEGIGKDLFDKIKDKFVIGCNFAFKFYPVTLTTFGDPNCFYNRYLRDLKSLPLIIGRQHKVINEIKLPNTILLKKAKTYSRDMKEGIFYPALTGALAVGLGIYLLDVGQIFLLGFDMGGKPAKENEESHSIMGGTGHIVLQNVNEQTISEFAKKNLIRLYKGKSKVPFLIKSHWYQDKFTHKGTGKVNFYYNEGKAERYFGVFKEEKKCEIYNVSLFSRIPEGIFKKIGYDKFFELLNNETFNQEKLREQIKHKIITKINS